MENSSQPSTGNPQQVAEPQDTTTSTGFQQTVSGEDLKSQSGNISVQQTGDPVTGMEFSAVKENTAYVWIFIVAFIVIVGMYFLVKLVKESKDEIDDYDEPEEVIVEESSSKKITTKKKTNKKKSAPNQRRKKVSKAKR